MLTLGIVLIVAGVCLERWLASRVRELRKANFEHQKSSLEHTLKTGEIGSFEEVEAAERRANQISRALVIRMAVPGVLYLVGLMFVFYGCLGRK
jgi:hypothetical protein